MTKVPSLNCFGRPEFPLYSWLFHKKKNRKSEGLFFDIVKATRRRNAMQSATAPSQQLTKKKLILDESSLDYFIFLGEKIAFIRRLQIAGFEVHLCGGGKVANNLSNVEKQLQLVKKFEPADYDRLKISRSESEFLDQNKVELVCVYLRDKSHRLISDYLDFFYKGKESIAENDFLNDVEGLSTIDDNSQMMERFLSLKSKQKIAEERPDLITENLLSACCRGDSLEEKQFSYYDAVLLLKMRPDLLPAFFMREKEGISEVMNDEYCAIKYDLIIELLKVDPYYFVINHRLFINDRISDEMFLTVIAQTISENENLFKRVLKDDADFRDMICDSSLDEEYKSKKLIQMGLQDYSEDFVTAEKHRNLTSIYLQDIQNLAKDIAQGFLQEVVFVVIPWKKKFDEKKFSAALALFPKLKQVILPESLAAATIEMPQGVVCEINDAEARTADFKRVVGLGYESAVARSRDVAAAPPVTSYSGSKIFTAKNSNKTKNLAVSNITPFQMEQGGEVLNGKSDGLRFRVAVDDYDLEKLESAEVVPEIFTRCKVRTLGKEVPNIFRAKDGEETHFLFHKNLRANQKTRLLSFSAQEVLQGVVGNISNLLIEKGSDGFLYATSAIDREFSYVVSHIINSRQEEADYQGIPENIKRIIDVYKSKPKDGPRPEKQAGESNIAWLNRLYESGNGFCGWRTMAVLHQLNMAADVDKSLYRAVNIDNNHRLLEVKSSNGNWVKVDLGGERRQLIYDEKDLAEERRSIAQSQVDIAAQHSSSRSSSLPQVSSSPSSSSPQVSSSQMLQLMLQRLRKSQEIAECASEAELLNKASRGNKIIIAAGSNLQNHANFLLTKARQAGRPTFYINSVEDIEAIAQNQVLIDSNGIPIFSKKSELEIFLEENEREKVPALIVINWDALGAGYRTTLNNMLDPEAKICGKDIPPSIKIVGLCGKMPLLDTPFLSRHDIKLKSRLFLETPQSAIEPLSASSSAGESAMQESLAVKKRDVADIAIAHQIDLQGMPQFLFGDVDPKGRILEWHESNFVKLCKESAEENTEKSKSKTSPVSFEFCNISEQDAKELQALFSLGKAQGYITHLGHHLPIPENFEFKFDDRGFDFSKFIEQLKAGKTLEIFTNSSAQEVPQNAQLINAYLFDQLLRGRKIEDRLYFAQPGLLQRSAGQNLELFISANLTQNQWYCLFNEAQKHKVKLKLYVAQDVELPQGFKDQVAPRVVETLPQPRLRPRIFVSNNPNAALAEIKSRDSQQVEEIKSAEVMETILNVEDYTYQDLISKTNFKPEVVGVDVVGFKDFEEKYSALFTDLKYGLNAGQKIILKGEFSDDLLQMLHPLIAGMPPFENVGDNLTIIIEEKQIEAPIAAAAAASSAASISFSCKSLDWLGINTYEILPFPDFPIPHNPDFDYREPKPATIFNLANSEADSAAFIQGRKNKFTEFLQHNSMLQLIGPSGVGKSGLIKFFEEENQDTTTVYRELSHLKEWADDKSDKVKILFIDESNIEDLQLTMFEPLKPGGTGRILYKGEIFELSQNHKVVFACNPIEFGGGRAVQKLFADNSIPAMYLEDFSAAYIYEKILKKSIYQELDSTIRAKISEAAFKQASENMIKEYLQENAQRKSDEEVQTVRELQEKILRSLSEKFDQVVSQEVMIESASASASSIPAMPTRVSNKNFIETDATSSTITSIKSSLEIRKKQRTGLFPSEAVGINGVIIKGDPGVGKSAMIAAILEDSKITELPKDAALINPNQQYYIKVDAGALEKKELIIKAFENGYVLWIDELNSCIKEGLEKTLNAALTGSHPNGEKKKAKAGFMLLSSINGNDLEERSQLSPAILHRAELLDMKKIKQYSQEDFENIIRHWNPQEENIAEEAEALKELANMHDGSDLSLRSLKRIFTATPNVAAHYAAKPFMITPSAQVAPMQFDNFFANIAEEIEVG